jgi:hypothetical protein
MSKKKNTLKDLDEFLKQQAASLVTPEPVSAKPETVVPPTDYARTERSGDEVTTDLIYKNLYALAEQDPDSFRQKLYALIIQILEAQSTSLPEDKMLINTALYLKSGEHWKESIREYWKKNG